MSVAENLRLARLSATDAEIREAARRARAEEFIEKLPKGYDTVIGERGLRLSGGRKAAPVHRAGVFEKTRRYWYWMKPAPIWTRKTSG